MAVGSQSHTAQKTSHEIHWEGKPRRVAASALVRSSRSWTEDWAFIGFLGEGELSRVEISRVGIGGIPRLELGIFYSV